MSLARTEATQLVREARRVTADVQRRAEKVVKDLEQRAERAMGTLERRAVKAMEPVLGRSFATRRDLQDLRARIEHLEKQIKALMVRAAA